MPGESLEPAQIRAIKRAMQRVLEANDGSQTKTAKVLGISQGHVSAVLSESRGVGTATILKLADVLGVTLEEVLGKEPEADDAALAAALASEPWQPWQRDAALSRRNLHGQLSTEQWRNWLRAIGTADAVSLGASRQEEEYAQRRAKAKRRAVAKK